MSTRYRLSLIMLLFFVASCSTLVLEPAEQDAIGQQASVRPRTKSGSTTNQSSLLSDPEVLHFFQTDHRSILIQHVELQDSVYVQTLTEEDMASFHITEEEKAFGDAYVVKLNEFLRQR